MPDVLFIHAAPVATRVLAAATSFEEVSRPWDLAERFSTVSEDGDIAWNSQGTGRGRAEQGCHRWDSSLYDNNGETGIDDRG